MHCSNCFGGGWGVCLLFAKQRNTIAFAKVSKLLRVLYKEWIRKLRIWKPIPLTLCMHVYPWESPHGHPGIGYPPKMLVYTLCLEEVGRGKHRTLDTEHLVFRLCEYPESQPFKENLLIWMQTDLSTAPGHKSLLWLINMQLSPSPVVGDSSSRAWLSCVVLRLRDLAVWQTWGLPPVVAGQNQAGSLSSPGLSSTSVKWD